MRIVSIRHSGTHTLAKILYPLSQYMQNNCYTHTKSAFLRKIHDQLLNAEPIHAPYRHPARIWQSWKAEQAARPGCDYTMENFIDEHDNLIMLHGTGRVKFHVLDDPAKPVETIEHSQFNTAKINITDAMLEEIPARYIQFYELLTRGNNV